MLASMEETQTLPDPKPSRQGPVMDVVPPRTTSEAAVEPEPMATAPPDQDQPKASNPSMPPAHQKAPPKPKPPKQPKNGVTAAIFGTVIIVLGLAVLAVYAYLKQN
jgi:hypothetical protein